MSEDPAPSATPLKFRDGKWHFLCPAKSTLICGTEFIDNGYRVALAFEGSQHANFITPAHAHSVAAQVRAGEDDEIVLALADAIDKIADDAAELHSIWDRAGRPSGGLDKLAWGHA